MESCVSTVARIWLPLFEHTLFVADNEQQSQQQQQEQQQEQQQQQRQPQHQEHAATRSTETQTDIMNFQPRGRAMKPVELGWVSSRTRDDGVVVYSV